MSEYGGAIDAFEWADPARHLGRPTPAVDAETYLADLLAPPPTEIPSVTPASDPTSLSSWGGVAADQVARRPRHTWPALVAAAAALIVTVGWLVGAVGRHGPTRIATDPAVAPAERPPTEQQLRAPLPPQPTADPIPMPATHADQTAWEAITRWTDGDGSRGRYRSSSFTPALDFIVTEGWSRPLGVAEVPTGLAPLTRAGRPPSEGLYLARHKDDAGTDDWLARMREHPAIVVGSVEPTELGGHDAIEVRFEVTGSMSYVRLTEQHERRLEAGQVGVAIVADVEGDIVSALMLAETSGDLATVEAAAEPIIGSIHWRDHCHQS